MNSFLLLICWLPQADSGHSYHVVNKEKQTIVGQSNTELTLETSFGSAAIQADQVRSLNIRDGKHVFRFADGTTLTGQLKTSTLPLLTADGPKDIPVQDILSISVSVPATPVPNTIVDGVARNGVTYHLHVPENYAADDRLPAILILHGSNMNSRDYVNTIKTAWPDLANRYVLIGINGERRNPNSKPDRPAYNYSYVNFMGKSTYKGYPGTDRESPALVAEVMSDLQQEFKFTKVFVGGHSQGGYLTYMLTMHFPELFSGAFPVAGGMVIQADPTAFDKPQLRQLQRQIPIAIVHAPNDSTVKYSMSTSAFRSFVDDGFPMMQLFDDTKAGHMFANLPIPDAIEWLETMTSDLPAEILQSSVRLWKADQFHDALGLAHRLESMTLESPTATQFGEFQTVVSSHVSPVADGLLKSITANANGTWVQDYHRFYANFGFSADAKPVVAAYRQLAKKHKDEGNKLYSEARRLFQQQKKDEGYAKCQEIVDKFYASSRYRTVKTWLDNRVTKAK